MTNEYEERLFPLIFLFLDNLEYKSHSIIYEERKLILVKFPVLFFPSNYIILV